MQGETTYRMCTRCVMDTTDPDIRFDENGVCNNCTEYLEKAAIRLLHGEQAKNALDKIIASIREAGKGKDYDCIIGVSGGVDSTYVAYKVKQLGLRPLAVHFDNGWNSELAVSNIEKVLNKLGIDLFTYVIDWEEFKDLQLAFLEASTPDSEIPTDHAILAVLYRIADEHGIKYIISGNNFKNEGLQPVTWSYGHIDWQYIKGIQNRFGHVKLRSFPHLSIADYVYKTYIKRIRIISILNYMPFTKAEAMEVLQNELGWKYYGGKHYESIYTRFFQSYILPVKFGIDKRKAHLSTQVCMGEITREQALEELKKEICPKDLLENDREYVIKKFDLDEKGFERIMNLPPKTFRDYPNSYDFLKKLRNLLHFMRKKGLAYR